jgi:hypothetical protein
MVRLATLLTLLAAAGASAQYVRTQVEDAGHPLCVTWNKRDFMYQVDQAGSARNPSPTVGEAIDRSFASWQAVSDACSDFTFTRGPDLDHPATGRNTTQTNAIIWRERSCDGVVPDNDPCWLAENDNCSSVYSCWPYQPGVLALTTVTHSIRTGAIYDADIELNGGDHLFTTVDTPKCTTVDALTCVATDVQNTLTHEIGHAVGFAHSPDPKSTMFWQADDGELSKRVIDSDTKAGFCAIYPRGGPPLPCDPAQQSQRAIDARESGTPQASQLGCASATGLPLAVALLLLTRRRGARGEGRR